MFDEKKAECCHCKRIYLKEMMMQITKTWIHACIRCYNIKKKEAA